MTWSATGAIAGLMAGVGFLLLASWLRARRPLRMIDRIGPFVGLPGHASAARRDPTIRLHTIARQLGSASSRRGADPQLAARLARAGATVSPSQYRVEQLAWAGAGLAGGLVIGPLLASTGSTMLVTVVLAGTGAVGGWTACDVHLRRRIAARQRVIQGQVPMLADLVALAVSAGSTPVAALAGAASATGGPLGHDVQRAIAGIRSGDPVDAGLRRLAAATGVACLQRFIDALLVAIELGSPVAEVVRAQAQDIRAEERRRLMESAGRKDIAMLVPIVFLVLPSVVLIALFPGVQTLHLVVP